MDNFFFGSVSGAAQMVVGHPLDTIKVWKQNNYQIKINNLKPKILFRGVLFPILASSMSTGVQFHCYHNNPGIIGGISAGFFSSLIIAPFDYYKIKYQMKFFNGNNKLPLIPRGFGITILREIPSMSSYFSTYYLFLSKDYNPFFSGGMAGIASWIISYPLDSLKTRIQTGDTYMEAIKKGNYFKGLPYCLVRAFIVNGTGFGIASLFKNFINK